MRDDVHVELVGAGGTCAEALCTGEAGLPAEAGHQEEHGGLSVQLTRAHPTTALSCAGRVAHFKIKTHAGAGVPGGYPGTRVSHVSLS